MKEITKAFISFPVLAYESVIRHGTPRKPTAIERVILKMSAQSTKSKTYSGVSISRIFTDIFCMPDADGIIRPSIDNLILLQALSSDKNTNDLKNIAIKDLNITSSGEHMLKNDMLAAIPVENDITHIYDPILLGIIGKSAQGRLSNAKNDLFIDDTPFCGIYPVDILKNDIIKNRPPWFHSNSIIERMECKKTSVLWSEVEATLAVSEQGRMFFAFKDEAHTAYLNALDGNTVFTRFISPVVSGGEKGICSDFLVSMNIKDMYQKIENIFPLSHLNRRAIFKKGVYFLQEIPGVIEAPNEIPEHTVIFVFNVKGASPNGDIIWNGNQTGLRINLSDSFPVPGGVFYDGKGLLMAAGIFKLDVINKSFDAPLGYSYSEHLIPADLNESLEKIARHLEASDNIMDRLIPAMWLPDGIVWNNLVEQIINTNAALENMLRQIMELRDRYCNLTGNESVPGWDAHIRTLVIAWNKNQKMNFDESTVNGIVKRLANCETKNNKAMDIIATILQEHINPAKEKSATLSQKEKRSQNEPGFEAIPQICGRGIRKKDSVLVQKTNK
jgi:hypothetical protein